MQLPIGLVDFIQLVVCCDNDIQVRLGCMARVRIGDLPAGETSDKKVLMEMDFIY